MWHWSVTSDRVLIGIVGGNEIAAIRIDAISLRRCCAETERGLGLLSSPSDIPIRA